MDTYICIGIAMGIFLISVARQLLLSIQVSQTKHTHTYNIMYMNTMCIAH